MSIPVKQIPNFRGGQRLGYIDPSRGSVNVPNLAAMVPGAPKTSLSPRDLSSQIANAYDRSAKSKAPVTIPTDINSPKLQGLANLGQGVESAGNSVYKAADAMAQFTGRLVESRDRTVASEAMSAYRQGYASYANEIIGSENYEEWVPNWQERADAIKAEYLPRMSARGRPMLETMFNDSFGKSAAGLISESGQVAFSREKGMYNLKIQEARNDGDQRKADALADSALKRGMMDSSEHAGVKYANRIQASKVRIEATIVSDPASAKEEIEMADIPTDLKTDLTKLADAGMRTKRVERYGILEKRIKNALVVSDEQLDALRKDPNFSRYIVSDEDWSSLKRLMHDTPNTSPANQQSVINDISALNPASFKNETERTETLFELKKRVYDSFAKGQRKPWLDLIDQKMKGDPKAEYKSDARATVRMMMKSQMFGEYDTDDPEKDFDRWNAANEKANEFLISMFEWIDAPGQTEISSRTYREEMTRRRLKLPQPKKKGWLNRLNPFD